MANPPPLSASLVAAVGGRVRIACLSSTTVMGDSITAYGLGSTGNGLSTGSYQNSHVAWANDWLNANTLGGGLDVLNYLATPGAPLIDMINIQLPLALADGNDVVWMHGGVNDMNSLITGGNSTVATILSRVKTLLDALSPAKKAIIWDSIHPVLQSGTTGSAPRAFSFQMVNNLIRQLCETYPNVFFNDTYSVLVDTTSTALNALANTVRSDDGIHFRAYGAQLAGYASAKTIAANLRITKYKTAGANLLAALSGSGGTTTPGGGTISGSVPTGWNVQVASGAASVAVSTKQPDMTTLTMTNAGGADSVVYLQRTNLTGNNGSLPQGAVVQGRFGFQASGITNLRRLGLILRQNNNTTPNLFYGKYEDSSNEPAPIVFPSTAFAGVTGTMPWALPATTSQMEFIITAKLAASGGGLTLDIYDPELYVLN